MNHIASNIRFLRLLSSLSQQDLAKKVGGVTRSNIASYERKIAKPNIEVLLRLAKVFQINLVALVREDMSKQIDTDKNLLVQLQAFNKSYRKELEQDQTTNIEQLIAETEKTKKTPPPPPKPNTELIQLFLAKRRRNPHKIVQGALGLQHIPVQIDGMIQSLLQMRRQAHAINFYNDVHTIATNIEKISKLLETKINLQDFNK